MIIEIGDNSLALSLCGKEKDDEEEVYITDDYFVFSNKNVPGKPITIHYYHGAGYNPNLADRHRLVVPKESDVLEHMGYLFYRNYTKIVQNKKALFPFTHPTNNIVEDLIFRQNCIADDKDSLSDFLVIIQNSSHLISREKYKDFHNTIKCLKEIRNTNLEAIDETKQQIKEFLDYLQKLEKQEGVLSVSSDNLEKFWSFDPLFSSNQRRVIENLDYDLQQASQKENALKNQQEIIKNYTKTYKQRLADLQAFKNRDYEYLKKLAAKNNGGYTTTYLHFPYFNQNFTFQSKTRSRKAHA